MPDRLLTELPWDTEFFGFPIGRVDIAGASAERFEAIEQEAHEHGILCAYADLDAADTNTSVLAQRFGYRLVEVGINFQHPDGRFTPRPGPSVVRRGVPEDLHLLEPSIQQVEDWSRYGADPRFGPEAARRMYRVWIERAATSGDDRMLSIAEDESGVTGFATHARGAPDRMDLISVTKPGTGAADAFYDFFHRWARPGLVEAGDAAVRNIAIIRFLERCGYRATRSTYRFHRWFDEGRGTPHRATAEARHRLTSSDGSSDEHRSVGCTGCSGWRLRGRVPPGARCRPSTASDHCRTTRGSTASVASASSP